MGGADYQPRHHLNPEKKIQKNVVKSFQSKYFSFLISTSCTPTCSYYTNDTMLLIA
jgi:hypothetical protein